MASSIDATKPVEGSPTTASVRSNFLAAKAEIEALQAVGITAVSALDVDCSQGTYFTKTISTASMFDFINVPASQAYAFTLRVNHTAGSITWPTEVVWPDDTAPELTTGNKHLFFFVTEDGGTTWRGAFLADYAS